jgi:hypothetical protein
MDGKIEQHVCIKFCVKLGNSAIETLEMLHEAFGDSLSRTAVFEWHSCLKAGRVSVEDDKRSGRPSSSKTPENVEKNARTHPRRPSPSFGVCQILTENLNMCRIATKFVPQLLTNDQKQWHVNVCLELREKANEDPTFTSISRIMTVDEIWIYSYDPETKQQLSQWRSPQSLRAKKARQVRSSTKSMLIVFFDVEGIVHSEFVPPSTTINSDFYCDVLRCLRENVQR